MLLFNKNTDTEIVVIAEIGVNHMGSFDWIINMLPQVKAAGADAIKFQLFTPDLYSSRSNVERYKLIIIYLRIYLSFYIKFNFLFI